MSDYGRYGDSSRTTRRDRDGGGRGRERPEQGGRYDRDEHHERGGGIFGGIFGGGRDRDQGRDRHQDQGNRSGGWSASGRTSDYDRDEHRRERNHEPDRHQDQQRGGERQFGRDDERPGLPIDETGRLIASNKVEGTAVYGGDGGRLGSIYNFMVDKFSGKVEYAVMTYGGFMGMGTRYYPLPWRTLSYDRRQGGYRIHLTERDLKDAPSFDRDSEPDFNRNYGERVHGWYGLNY